MRQTTQLIAIVTALSLLGGRALAMPAPCTEQQMMTDSDLVVDASCIQVICSGSPVSEADKTITPYLSTLTPSKSEKGGLPNSFQIHGSLVEWKGQPPAGFWIQPAVKEGWAGKLYLKKKVDGTYTSTCWNAMTEDAQLSKPKPLPGCVAGDGGVHDGAPATADGGVKTDGSAPSSDDGCGCEVGRARTDAALPLVLLALISMSLLFGVRRRSARCSASPGRRGLL